MPKISVLLPGWNEKDTIFKAIESFKNQTSQDFNIYMILGGKDSKIQEAKSLKWEKLIILNQDVPNKNRALNKALDHPEIGEILILSDIDCEFPSNYIQVYAEAFQDPQKNVIAGRCQSFKLDNNFIERYLRNNETRRISHLPDQGDYLVGANFAVRKSFLLETIGHFDENTKSSTDARFAVQMKEHNENIFLCKESIVYSDFNTQNLPKMIKQQSRWVRNVIIFGKNFHTKRAFLTQIFLALISWYIILLAPICIVISKLLLNSTLLTYLIIISWIFLGGLMAYKYFRDLNHGNHSIFVSIRNILGAIGLIFIIGTIQIVGSTKAIFYRDTTKSWKK